MVAEPVGKLIGAAILGSRAGLEAYTVHHSSLNRFPGILVVQSAHAGSLISTVGHDFGLPSSSNVTLYCRPVVGLTSLVPSFLSSSHIEPLGTSSLSTPLVAFSGRLQWIVKVVASSVVYHDLQAAGCGAGGAAAS